MPNARRKSNRVKATVAFYRNDIYISRKTVYPEWERDLRNLAIDFCIPEPKVNEIISDVISSASVCDPDITLYRRAHKRILALIK